MQVIKAKPPLVLVIVHVLWRDIQSVRLLDDTIDSEHTGNYAEPVHSKARFHVSDSTWHHAQSPPHLVLRSSTRKFLFCMIPKNACTEFLSLVMRLDGMEEPDWNPTSANLRQDSVHFNARREHLFLKNDDRASFEDILQRDEYNGWVKAVFLRNPLERLISAYKSKVQTGYFKEHYPSNLTFKEFVSRVETDGVDDNMDPHIRPQSYICGLDETLGQYDIVGRFDNLADDANEMVGLIGSQLVAEMLSKGWGPYKNQSLFGQPRDVREKGAQMMTVTHASEESVLQQQAGSSPVGVARFDVDSSPSRGDTAPRGDAVAEESVFSFNTGFEMDSSFADLKRQVEGDSELKARIQRLYAQDYDLIERGRQRGGAGLSV